MALTEVLDGAMRESVEACEELPLVLEMSRAEFARGPVREAAGPKAVELRDTAHGLSTFAAEAVAAGELLFAEDALVRWESMGEAAYGRVLAVLRERRWPLGNEVRVARQLAAFAAAPREARRAALKLYAPSIRSLPAAHGRLIGDVASAAAADALAGVRAKDLAKFVVVADVNSTGEAVYARVSRCQHSCAPNATVVHHGCDGRIGVYALRAVAAGEEVRFAYQGHSSILMMPTPFRRQSLSRLGFTCACARCEAATDAEEPARMDLALACARLCVADCAFPAAEDTDFEEVWACFKACRAAFGPAHWTSGTLALALLDGAAVQLERDDAYKCDARVVAALACDTLTWFAQHDFLRGSLLHAKAFFAVQYVRGHLAAAPGTVHRAAPPLPPAPPPEAVEPME